MPNHIEVRSAQHISQQGLAQVRLLTPGSRLASWILHMPCLALGKARALACFGPELTPSCILETWQTSTLIV